MRDFFIFHDVLILWRSALDLIFCYLELSLSLGRINMAKPAHRFFKTAQAEPGRISNQTRMTSVSCHFVYVGLPKIQSRNIDQKILPLEKFYAPKGQNDLFQGLKWGIVRICRSTGSWDMAKNIWYQVFQFSRFCKFYSAIFLSICIIHVPRSENCPKGRL